MEEVDLVVAQYKVGKLLEAAQDYMEPYVEALEKWEAENFPEITRFKANRKHAGVLLGWISEALKSRKGKPDKVDANLLKQLSDDFSFFK